MFLNITKILFTCYGIKLELIVQKEKKMQRIPVNQKYLCNVTCSVLKKFAEASTSFLSRTVKKIEAGAWNMNKQCM